MGVRWVAGPPGGAEGDRAAAGGEGPRHDPTGELLLRARRDPEAFGEVWDRCGPELLEWFARRTGSPLTAMELVAETFAQALAGLHRYDPALGSGWGWLFGIAVHQLHRTTRRGAVERRHRARLAIDVQVLGTDDLDRVVEIVDAQRRGGELRAALDELSDGVRAAVELRVAHDLPYPEVAARLGCTVTSARVRVLRGLRQLALALVPD